MERKITESTAATFASGDPVVFETSEVKERMPRSSPSFWMYLYNHIHATNWPIVDTTAIQMAEYPCR